MYSPSVSLALSRALLQTLSFTATHHSKPCHSLPLITPNPLIHSHSSLQTLSFTATHHSKPCHSLPLITPNLVIHCHSSLQTLSFTPTHHSKPCHSLSLIISNPVIHSHSTLPTPLSVCDFADCNARIDALCISSAPCAHRVTARVYEG